jgi:hypothetical protein
MSAWNHWYHVMGSTYGTWLRGDPRGWRSRHHREHVDGDYKDPPPPGTYDALYRRSKELMKQAEVYFTPEQRIIAGRAIIDQFFRLQVQVIAVSVDAVHLHLLAKFLLDDVRDKVGRAKKNASHAMHDAGYLGEIWGKRCSAVPVRDRKHQVNVFGYILDHAQKGAWIWSFSQGLYWAK